MTPKFKSASSGQAVPVTLKVAEASRQFANLWKERGPGRSYDFSHLDREFAEYEAIVAEFAGAELVGARAFEIGCGQRPHRLFTLIAHGVDARAVDMDKVVVDMSAGDLWRSFATNGVERGVKTSLRHVLFDRGEYRSLRDFLSVRAGHPFDWPLHRIVHGTAADPGLWPAEPIDFVLSEDVFEHIPRDVLPQVCGILAERLSDSGVALIRPMVFTGIRGGHHVDWYNTDPNRARSCAPWDHLRQRLHPANTYLNELTLADYRQLFAGHFEVLAERVKSPDVGRAFMTAEVRAELGAYSDEELFSNHVGFILRRKRGALR